MLIQADRARVSTTALMRQPRGRVDLMYPSESTDDDDPEEVLLPVQGYLLHADLPPVVKKP